MRPVGPVLGDIEGNLAASTAAIAGAVADGAQIVVLPELVTSGYMFAHAGEARSAALPAGDPALESWVLRPGVPGGNPGGRGRRRGTDCGTSELAAAAAPRGRAAGRGHHRNVGSPHNRVAIAVCDRTGVEHGQSWAESTVIIDADGWVVAEAGAGPGAAIAEVDLTASRGKNLTEHVHVHVHVHNDRRLDLY
jgi:predicted amidohydrolase